MASSKLRKTLGVFSFQAGRACGKDWETGSRREERVVLGLLCRSKIRV